MFWHHSAECGIHLHLIDRFRSLSLQMLKFDVSGSHFEYSCHNWIESLLRLMKTDLTEREYEILNLIVQEYTMKEIASQLYIAQGTVEKHRKNILYKLKARNTAGMIIHALTQGIIILTDDGKVEIKPP